ncbi:MAG: hypothetical protein EXS15_07100 [Phycisphaerales bacterium]|nr:hypothetical protein [Phycisphaerales bacterium]
MEETPHSAPRLNPLAHPFSADLLRRQWKLRRDSYAQAHLYHDVRIRVHRSLTWLATSESRRTEESDTKLIELWAAAGGLFARWSEALGAPLGDRESTASFSRQILHWDRDGIMPAMLDGMRASAMFMWSDPYLSKAMGSRAESGSVGASEALPADLTALLAGILERVAITVRQLTLGASAYGGSQNRDAVQRSVVALQMLVPAFIQIITDHGYVDDWGALCSPVRE